MANKTELMADIEQEELAAYLCGIKIDEDNDDYENDIDSALIDKFDITLEQFREISQAMFKVMNIGISPLTNSAFIGFSDNKAGVWLAKKDVTGEFIGSVIQWACEGTPPKPGKGFEKDITSKGKVEYTITLRKPANDKKQSPSAQG